MEHRMKVFKYGVIGDLPPEAVEELFRAHALRNELVEIELRHAERIAQVWTRHTDLAAAQANVDAADAVVEQAVQAGKDYRQKNRTTKIPADLRQIVSEKRQVLRDARAVLRDAKARAYPMMKPQLITANDERKADVKATYRRYVDQGLYWATYNDVTAHHQTAVKAIAAKRKNGQPAQLRFHRWQGEGTLTVQLQRGEGAPPRTPEVLADENGRYSNVAYLTPCLDPDELATMRRSDQRKRTLGTFRFRIGSGDAAGLVEVPVRIHRPIPLDGDVTMIHISRRREGPKFKVSVSVVVRLNPVPQRTQGRMIAAHIGWRAKPDKSMRIAVIAGAQPPPPSLEEIVHDHGDWYEVVVPASWREVHARGESLRSTRDDNMNRMKDALAAWAQDHPDVEGLEQVKQWRSPGRLAKLAFGWRDDPPPDGEEITAELEAWRKQDKHLWLWQSSERAQIIGRRNDYYRQVAAWLTAEAGLIALDSWTIRRRVPEVEDEDPHLERRARANGVLAAPGELRSFLEVAAQERGVAIAPEMTVAGLHLDCGTPLDRGERRDQIMVFCPTCERVVDQDYNALQSLLRAVEP
jgi:hypothetical protein